MELILKQGSSRVELFPAFWPSYFLSKLSTIALEQRQIKMFGKVHDEPRLTAWFGLGYSYSGVSHPLKLIPELLNPLHNAVRDLTTFDLNSVLINCYRNGSDHMGWHRDNERNIGPEVIASLSFGVTRKFKIRNRGSEEVWSIKLNSGDLLLMRNMQQDFEHCVPKSAKVSNVRYNLTFRRIIPAEQLC